MYSFQNSIIKDRPVGDLWRSRLCVSESTNTRSISWVNFRPPLQNSSSNLSNTLARKTSGIWPGCVLCEDATVRSNGIKTLFPDTPPEYRTVNRVVKWFIVGATQGQHMRISQLWYTETDSNSNFVIQWYGSEFPYILWFWKRSCSYARTNVKSQQ